MVGGEKLGLLKVFREVVEGYKRHGIPVRWDEWVPDSMWTARGNVGMEKRMV